MTRTAAPTRELEVRWAYQDGDVDISSAHPVPAGADHATILAALAALAGDPGDIALEYRTHGTDDQWTGVHPAEWTAFEHSLTQGRVS